MADILAILKNTLLRVLRYQPILKERGTKASSYVAGEDSRNSELKKTRKEGCN